MAAPQHVYQIPNPIPADDVERQWHRELAVSANNSTWELLGPTADHDTPILTPEQTFDLLGRAYAAAYHWRAFNGPSSINAARAAWLCSRCHVVAGDGDAALRMAGLCAELTDGADGAGGIADFDHFYAAEARARALAALGELDQAMAARQVAAELLADLDDPEDQKIAAEDLGAGPWFGLTSHLAAETDR